MRARAVNGYRIAAPRKAVVAGVGGCHVGELPGLRIDASRSIGHNGPALHDLNLGLDAYTRLREVIRGNKPLRVITVPVDQRFTFIVIAVLR